MEEKSLIQYKEILLNSSIKSLKNKCKELNLFFCDITEKNINNKVDYIIKYEQKNLKKILKLKYGFIFFYENNIFLNITDSKTYLITKNILIFENDIEYNFLDLIKSYENILEFNDFYKITNKVLKEKTKLISLKFNKVSQILEYKNLMKNQYKFLENYFDNNKFPNQFQNKIVDYFVHNLSPMRLEMLLKSGNHKFINPISGNTYDSERGIYTTLQTHKCKTGRFLGFYPSLIFSKELANDFGYIFNFNFNFGRINKFSYVKGQIFKTGEKEYSAVEKGALKLCKSKDKSHEIVFYTDHIKLKDYLESIIFTDEKVYNTFKKMKDIKFKNKMKLIL